MSSDKTGRRIACISAENNKTLIVGLDLTGIIG